MYIVRDIFHLKFGAAREARVLVEESRALIERIGYGNTRALTDFTGHSYRLILETGFDSLADYEQRLTDGMHEPDWQDWYRRFVPLVNSSEREILRVVE